MERPANKTLAMIVVVIAMMGVGGGIWNMMRSREPALPEVTKGPFVILSGSENASLEPIVTGFCRTQGWACEMSYAGSVEIKLRLEEPETDFDAVWPAHGRWIEMGDKRRRVKDARSIMQSPVVLGVARPEARKLGLTEGPVSTRDLVALVREGKLRFLMSSATQSNSGFSAYIAMLAALAGNPEVLDESVLAQESLREDLRGLLGGVVRSAGSSGWLKDLYLAGAEHGLYTAMVNYEAVIIETNRELESRGLPPLQVIYPIDGVAIADSPLGLVAREGADGAEREQFFLALRDHLLSPEVQGQLAAMGRRTGVAGVTTGLDPTVFRKEWGIDVERVLPAIRFPSVATIDAALALYQELLRKPSLTALCLDFSASMKPAGELELKRAVHFLFDAESSRRYMLQATPEDVAIIIPFSFRPWNPIVAKGPDEMVKASEGVVGLQPSGGTDIYACARTALETIAARPELETHVPALVLMTDGRSGGDPKAFQEFYKDFGRDIPIHSITFGEAEDGQLEILADRSRGRVFDGRKGLERAFREAKGYN